MDAIPLLVEFAGPASLEVERHRDSPLPVVGNGFPGTFVVFPTERLRISLPTDQIVFTDAANGCVRVGFGGLRFVGAEDAHLVFVRVHELYPPERLSPDRSHTMRLDARRVTTVVVDGTPAWPRSRRAGPRPA
jgi:hypothetical protein